MHTCRLLMVSGPLIRGFVSSTPLPRPENTRRLSGYESTGFDCEPGHVAPLGRSHAPGTAPLQGYLAQKKTPDPPRTQGIGLR